MNDETSEFKQLILLYNQNVEKKKIIKEKLKEIQKVIWELELRLYMKTNRIEIENVDKNTKKIIEKTKKKVEKKFEKSTDGNNVKV